jgi:hypothetical protein
MTMKRHGLPLGNNDLSVTVGRSPTLALHAQDPNVTTGVWMQRQRAVDDSQPHLADGTHRDFPKVTLHGGEDRSEIRTGVEQGQ